MSRKNRSYELPEEVIAVLECSPNLLPCKRFRHAAIFCFTDHMKNDKCQQCVASADRKRIENDLAVGGMAEEQEQLKQSLRGEPKICREEYRRRYPK